MRSMVRKKEKDSRGVRTRMRLKVERVTPELQEELCVYTNELSMGNCSLTIKYLNSSLLSLLLSLSVSSPSLAYRAVGDTVREYTPYTNFIALRCTFSTFSMFVVV